MSDWTPTPDQKRGIEVLLHSLGDQSIRDAERQCAVVGVLVQNLTDSKRLLGGL